ncbi:acylphosphatase [Aromatoleum diolicum]|nr:acylphosphatase [Aromatoleum diolicum]
MIIARRLMIRGRVQGVGYRASAQFEAERLGLSGWVRNRGDGSVEALIAGPETAVEQFVAWAHRGPTHAQVAAIEITVTDVPESPTFTVQATL